ncbi:hypothetical protein U27_02943 [Candidatus Vecturithrix granuli]|uniref:Uncharacterized protein n=1 Tax=Vecturithrix granuli TaxID=1499967 RepID=A0A081BUH7_VECG1|nr:hypothetical protein U27_02943 [Candidatus Vecturithrix granuli]
MSTKHTKYTNNSHEMVFGFFKKKILSHPVHIPYFDVFYGLLPHIDEIRFVLYWPYIEISRYCENEKSISEIFVYMI